MSHPKRLNAFLQDDADGIYCFYSDYAALAAEKEAETKAVFDAIRLITQLRDENERLRKAGDAMATIIKPPAHGTGEWDGEYDAWFAAKEVQK